MRFGNRLRALKRLNAEVNSLETLLGVSRLQSIPPHLEVDFSSKCNLRCPMCHQSKIDMGSYRLSDQQVNRLIDSLPSISTVMIAGLGEPLLYPRLDEFLSYASRYQCRIHLFTNGQLIHRKLSSLRHVHRISVSLDAATAETFETLRRGAKFDRVCKNIRLLRRALPAAEIVTSTVVNRANLREVASIVELAANLGMDEVHLSPVDHTPELALRPCDLAPYGRQLEQARTIDIRIFDNISASHFVTGSCPGNDESGQLINRRRETARGPLDDECAVLPSLRVQPGLIQGLTPGDEMRELKNRAARLRRHYAALLETLAQHSNCLRLPYCSVPWKYSFAQSNGQARLCPFAEVPVGPIEVVLGGRYNSPLLESLRESMGRMEPLLQVCRNCRDDHRRFQHDSLEMILSRHQPGFKRGTMWLSKLFRDPGSPLRRFPLP